MKLKSQTFYLPCPHLPKKGRYEKKESRELNDQKRRQADSPSQAENHFREAVQRVSAPSELTKLEGDELSVSWKPGSGKNGANSSSIGMFRRDAILEFTINEKMMCINPPNLRNPELSGKPVGRTDKWGVGVSPALALACFERDHLFT